MFGLASSEWLEWLNYPGLEVWKFGNLAIFTALAVYLLRRRISEALIARREAIRQELLRAQGERDRALAQLAEADTLLIRLDTDIQAVRAQALQEAESERQRLAASTVSEMEKLKQQAQREMETADKVARKGLRQFLATRSIQHARESIRGQMGPDDDARLIKENIGELRRTSV